MILVKGVLWELVGALINKYGEELDCFVLEAQDAMYNQLDKQLKSTKPELRIITGILKGFQNVLTEIKLPKFQSKIHYFSYFPQILLKQISN